MSEFRVHPPTEPIVVRSAPIYDPGASERTVSTSGGRVEAELVAALAALDRVRALFAGGPDTPRRTTWNYDNSGGGPPVECVEVPKADLRAALDGPHG